MANQRQILCGQVSSLSVPFEDRNPVRLRLRGSTRNVFLTIEDVRRAMWRDIPQVFQDLLDIATYVYCGDQTVSRGRADVDAMGAHWRRSLFYRIEVRNPDFWNDHHVRDELVATLSFLSDDEYLFDFVKLKERGESQPMIEYGDEPFTGDIDEVMLFSGGMDSLAGAIEETLRERRRVLLVNHRSTDKLAPRHRQLVRELELKSSARAPVHMPIRINKVKGLGGEYTQRSRSFLYAALGATVASMVGLHRIRFYENGVVSLNLPVSVQAVGARATRTTHPRVLKGFERLFTLVGEKTFAVENRYFWKTKAEVVRSIGDAGCADLIGLSTSCAHTWEWSKDQTHCGTCSQCIDRRFAVLAAGLEMHDPKQSYKVDLLTGEREPGYPLTMLSAYVETANQIEGMDAQRFYERFGEAFRVFPYLDGNADGRALSLFDLHRRHAAAVTGVVDAAVRDHAAAIRKRTLPASCLVRLVSDASGATGSSPGPSRDTPSESGSPNLLRQRGAAWEVRFAGESSFFIPKSLGAALLQRLLSRPGRSISAVQLLCEVYKQKVPLLSEAADTLGDKDTMRAYYSRLIEFDTEIAKAEKDDNPTLRMSLEAEEDELLNEIRRVRGASGRLRTIPDEREKIRKLVGNAIRRSVKTIRKYSQPLAQHLIPPTLRCGRDLCYAPSEPIVWDT